MKFDLLPLPKKGDRVVVGLSGGVDSTMTTLLLQEAGCDVTCVTMSLWDDTGLSLPEGYKVPDSCFSPKEKDDIKENRAFCAAHNIPYVVVDVKQKYREEVIEYFKREYRAGRTPNPCVRCNSFIKFGAMLSGLKDLNIEYDYFCTGHYARVVKQCGSVDTLYGSEYPADENSSPPLIETALDNLKDQSYFLYRVPPAVLERVRFPLGGLTKSKVVAMARARGLQAAGKKESQDFVPPAVRGALFGDKPSIPGDIIDTDGRVLGRHKGVEYYTIGQRRGLGVSAPYPLYVSEIDKEHNLVVLGREDDLLCEGLIADDMVWPGGSGPEGAFPAYVKIRAASRPVSAFVRPYEAGAGESFSGRAYKVVFETPQRAVAPGQSVVFYRSVENGEVVSGVRSPGARISSAEDAPPAEGTATPNVLRAVIIGGGVIVRPIRKAMS